MFDLLPRQWLPALPSSDLGEEAVPVELAGERLALFRDPQGRPHALLDRCPHRGVALSLGEVTEDGCLQCPFHGWRFRGDGTCAAVPLNPDARRERLGATAVAVQERGGLVWAFTAPGVAAPTQGPAVPELLEDPRATVRMFSRDWECHWTRAMENMLDVPHLPYVHRRTIGAGLPDPLHARLHQDIEELPTGFRLRWGFDGPGKDAAWLEWWRPAGMVLNLGAAPVPYRQHVWCVPVAARRTRMLIATAVVLPRGMGWATAVTGGFEKRILLEDQAVVESSEPAEVPPAADEASVATDLATLRFRAWYRRQVAGDAGGAPSGAA